MSKPAALDLVERARALAPLISNEADEIERTRRLTPAVTAALIENGLYRALLPQSLGGAEAPLAIFMQMQEEIAKADASTAWCLGQCSVCAMVAAYLDRDVAEEIFNKPPGILAWGAIAHEVRVVSGGYRASARWDFASGSRQASWLGAHVRILEEDGTPRRKPDGTPEIRTILFPVASAIMHDVWDVIGLKGTGTDSYSVDNLFIPEKFAALRDEPSALREPGPIYKIPTHYVFAMGFAATSVGLARAMLDSAIDLSRRKTPQGLSAMRENNAVQGLIGRTEATLRAAGAYLYSTAAEVWRDLEAGAPVTEAHRIAMRIAATWTIHRSTAVVDTAYHMAGATAVFAANPFERRFRDMHTIAQQIQARDTHYEDAGRAILSDKLQAPPTAR
ncbi:acyl-CoA dehydrogenase family protein [Bradyrhizobium sp.]|uniref:acyl-CoA dehydrogenase family protein n=1 Tax=Bradyrhizobium sp. TaxID=376 RepID=UPI002D5C7EAC|nr:acyl-CoA dehydrogenase family protein [Bradyrhizobium sp.]HZR75064.1 acyl-CoA dehydrogenase family protein [Bradyrhizobium sp.]